MTMLSMSNEGVVMVGLLFRTSEGVWFGGPEMGMSGLVAAALGEVGGASQLWSWETKVFFRDTDN